MTSQIPPSEGEPARPGEITDLLRLLEEGDRTAMDRLFAVVYEQLRRLARRQLAAAGRHGTLNTTDLVHETYLKLSQGASWSLRDRYHFYATTARAMRMVIIDDARRRWRRKRGGGEAVLSLDRFEGALRGPEKSEELLALDDALTRLETAEPDLARLVEWRFFAGLSVEDIAKTLEISERTVKRHWRAARAFLYQNLSARESRP
jgi:RNA polymerase sigma factor (TIGR02999 family)